MKRIYPLFLLLPLCGCYNLLVVNVGAANKSASSLATPLDPAVACAALATRSVTIHATTGADAKPQIELEPAAQTCEEVLKGIQKGKGGAK
jgi:hypothetical protein